MITIEDLDDFLCNNNGNGELYYCYTSQIKKYRKKVRNIKRSLSRNVNKCKKFNYISDFFEHFKDRTVVSGPENYNFLTESLLKHGWIPDYPLTLYFSPKRKRWLIRNGHHRLNICIENNINLIPTIIRNKHE